MVETAEFDQALAMISAKDNTSFYRRNDGKLMLRPCGAKPSYRFAAHFIGWTGAAAALVVLLRHIFSLQVVLPPDQLMIALYAWNVLGVIFLARNMLNGSRQRLICFLFLTPLCVTLVLCFASLAMHIYWLIMFTHK